MILAAVDIYEVLIAAVALATVGALGLGLVDRRSRRVRVERDEAEHDARELRARVAELEARPDMTRLAKALDAHEQRAGERHQKTIRVLERIADAWDVRLKDGRS